MPSDSGASLWQADEWDDGMKPRGSIWENMLIFFSSFSLFKLSRSSSKGLALVWDFLEVKGVLFGLSGCWLERDMRVERMRIERRREDLFVLFIYRSHSSHPIIFPKTTSKTDSLSISRYRVLLYVLVHKSCGDGLYMAYTQLHNRGVTYLYQKILWKLKAPT